MKSRRSILLTAAVAMAVSALPGRAAGEKLIIAEPVHGTGYLPLYVGIRKGFFKAEGLEIEVVTMLAGGAHRNAVITKQAWGFIGGPEHNAFAKARGAELRTIANVVNRGNVYFVAKKGMAPEGKNFAAFLKGKKIATSPYATTPNSITRYLLKTWGLDAKTDVTLLELGPGNEVAAVQTGQADIAVTTEPFLTQGIERGLWAEPFYNVPRELGPYAYSTINIRAESVEKEPETVRKFARVMRRSLEYLHKNRAEAVAIAKQEFPTMNDKDLQATLKRSFDDQMWAEDGMVTRESWATAQKVVRTADILKQDIAYDAIIDMRFMKEAGQ